MEPSNICLKFFNYMKETRNCRSWWGRMEDMLIKLDIPMSYLTNNDRSTTKKVVKCKLITKSVRKVAK